VGWDRLEVSLPPTEEEERKKERMNHKIANKVAPKVNAEKEEEQCCAGRLKKYAQGKEKERQGPACGKKGTRGQEGHTARSKEKGKQFE